ncbi:MAG: PAS domain S-box protein, partial [Promethearchaeota archaeon]
RYLQAISLVVALFFINKKINHNLILVIYLVITIILLFLIFSGLFPKCYVDSPIPGLTPFKIFSEYIINGILLVSVFLMFKLKKNFDLTIFWLMILSIIFTIASELMFTLYIGVFDIQNLIGHIFKVLAFFIAYKAIIEIGIEKPFKLMFRKLKQSELALKKKASDLELAYSETEQIFDASLALRIINEKHDIVKVNDTFCQLFQVEPEEIIGKKCYDVMFHEYCHTNICCMNQIIQENKKMVEYEIELKKKDGKVLTLLVNSVPYKTPSGEFFGIIQNYIDISERKITEIISNQLASIVDSSSDAIIGKTLDGIITSWNKSAELMYGYSKEEAIGCSIEMIIPVELYPELQDIMEIVKNGEKIANFETIRVTKGGNRLSVSLALSPIRDEENNIIGISTISRDITESKLAEKKLKESEQKFRLTFENAPDAIFWADPTNGKIINCNRQAELLLECTKDEIIGRHQKELHPPERVQYHKEMFKKHVEEGEGVVDEGEVITKSGKIIPVLINASNIEIGGIPLIQGIFHDITNIRLAEKRLKESEEKYRSLIEDSLEGVWVIDSEGKSSLVNPSMARMLGYKVEEMMGRTLFEFMDDEYFDITKEKIEDRKKGIGEEHEFEFLHKSGRKVHTMIRTTPIFDKNGQYEGAMAFITDETERKKAEQKLEKFVSTVSHELRTPITVLMMSIEYLKKSNKNITPEIENRLIEGISRNILLLNDLVEDILLISQIDEKKLQIEWKQYNPSQLVQENLEMMQKSIKNKNLTIETKIGKNITLYGDLKRIDQVFRIFIDNAIKYSKENTIIKIQAKDNYRGKYNNDNTEGVLFQIIDEGIGIREKDIPLLFERFFRTEDVIDIPGTGLGLAIAKSLVDLHEGEIFVDSEFGKGSTFSFFLPRKLRS